MWTEVIVVRSKTEEDAVVRLQSGAVVRGIRQTPAIRARTLAPERAEVEGALLEGSLVLFHYDDLAASRSVKALATVDPSLTFGCFASDIYTFDPYMEIHDVVDFYLAPTRLHRRVLMSQLYKPVYLLPECIDPSAMHEGTLLRVFPTKERKRLLWFGYPESFEKSMVSLVPILKLHVRNKSIDSFTLISDKTKLVNRFNLAIEPYDKTAFSQAAMSFDYCILSHFSLDLALNSYIKSPNKLVTSLFLGLIPLASRTPSYEDLLTEFGLERFLYDSPSDLNQKLSSLDPVADSSAIRDSGVVEALGERFSDASIAKAFLQIASEVAERDREGDLDIQPETLKQKTPEVQIRDHVLDFIPSIGRALRWRMR